MEDAMNPVTRIILLDHQKRWQSRWDEGRIADPPRTNPVRAGMMSGAGLALLRCRDLLIAAWPLRSRPGAKRPL
jgi:hypothetical protein